MRRQPLGQKETQNDSQVQHLLVTVMTSAPPVSAVARILWIRRQVAGSRTAWTPKTSRETGRQSPTDDEGLKLQMSHQSIVCPQETFSDPDGSLSTKTPRKPLEEYASTRRTRGTSDASAWSAWGPGGSSSAEVRSALATTARCGSGGSARILGASKTSPLIGKSAVRLMNKKGAK